MNAIFGPELPQSDHFGASGDAPMQVVLALPGEAVHLPQGFEVTTADFARAGSDLILTGSDGGQIVVQNFFAYSDFPQLISAEGATLPGQLAAQLSGPLAPGQYAQAAPGAGPGAEPIGQVETVTGEATAIHADGTRELLQTGDQIFQGDVIETADGAAVGVVLADETTFSMAGNGRMVMDEMVFDPGSQAGTMNFSVVTGVFTFVSGQVAKGDPDAMVLNTPVATVGIRGTQVGLSYSEGHPLQVVLMEEQNGFVGEVVVSNQAGTIILNQANQGVFVAALTDAPEAPQILTESAVTEVFGGTLGYMPANDNFNPYGIVPAFGDQGQNDTGPGQFETAAGGPDDGGASFTPVDSGITFGSTGINVIPPPQVFVPPVPTPPATGGGTDTGAIVESNAAVEPAPVSTSPPPYVPGSPYVFVDPATVVTSLYSNPGVTGTSTVATTTNTVSSGTSGNDYIGILALSSGTNLYNNLSAFGGSGDDIISIVQAVSASGGIATHTDVGVSITADLTGGAGSGNDMVDLHLSAYFDYAANDTDNYAKLYPTDVVIDLGGGNNVASVTEEASGHLSPGSPGDGAYAIATVSDAINQIDAYGTGADTVSFTAFADAHAQAAAGGAADATAIAKNVNLTADLADGSNTLIASVLAHGLATVASGNDAGVTVTNHENVIDYTGGDDADTVIAEFGAFGEATSHSGTGAQATIDFGSGNNFDADLGNGTNVAIVNWLATAFADANCTSDANAYLRMYNDNFTYQGGTGVDTVGFNIFGYALADSSSGNAFASATEIENNIVSINLSATSTVTTNTNSNDANVDITGVAYAFGWGLASASATLNNNQVVIDGSNYVDAVSVDLTAVAYASASSTAVAKAILYSSAVTVDLLDGPGDTVDINMVAFADALEGGSTGDGQAKIHDATINLTGGSGDDQANILISAFGSTQSTLTNNDLTLSGGAGADTFDVTIHGGVVKSNDITFEGGAGADQLTVDLTAGISATSNTLTLQYGSTSDVGDTVSLFGIAPDVNFEFDMTQFTNTNTSSLFTGGATPNSLAYGYYANTNGNLALWYDSDGFNTGATAVQVVEFDGIQPTITIGDIALVSP